MDRLIDGVLRTGPDCALLQARLSASEVFARAPFYGPVDDDRKDPQLPSKPPTALPCL